MQMKCVDCSSMALSKTWGNFCCTPVHFAISRLKFVFIPTALYIVPLLKVHYHCVFADNLCIWNV